MQNRRDKKYYLTYLLWYTLLFFASYFGIFLMFTLAQRSYIWTNDGLSLYLPKAYYFIEHTHELIRSFFSGNFAIPMYDFSIGLGHAAPLCLEPLYWIYLLFDESHVEMAFAVVMMVRFYAAGLAMTAFLMYFQNGRMASLLGTFSYLGCDFGLWACFRHSQFTILMLMLPLMLLSIEEICRRKQWYLCTVLVWIHLWCGYYFLYMNTIAMGVYFLIRFFCHREGRTVGAFFRNARTIIGSYLLGVLIGNTALVATFASYLNSSRTTSIDYGENTNYLFYGFSWVFNLFRGFLTAGRSPGAWVRLGFIPLIAVGVVLLLMKKGRRDLKAALAAGTLFLVIPAAAFVLSGFSSISNRWCYMYAFVLAVILAFTSKELLALTRKQMAVISAVMLAFLIEYGYELATRNAAHKWMMLVSIGAILLTMVMLIYVNRHRELPLQKRQGLIAGVMVISLWGVQFQTFMPNVSSLITEFCKAGHALEKISSTPLAAADEIKDDSFYRVASKRVNTELQGASQVLGYYGTVHYDNAASRDIQDFYRTLGLSSWSLVRMKGFDGRAMTDTLLSVKYYFLDKGERQDLPYGYTKIDEVIKNGMPYEIFENEYALPIGYTYDSVMDRNELEKIETPMRQETLMQTAVLEHADESGLPTVTANEVETTAYPLDVAKIEHSDRVILKEDSLKVKAAGEKITLHFEVPEASEIYLYVKKPFWNSTGSATIQYSCGEYAHNYLLHGKKNTYRTGQEDLVVNMGCQKPGETTCTLTFPRSLTITFEDVQIICQPMSKLKTYTDERKENVLEDVQIGADCVTGNISLSKDKLLVLSIPWDSGWTAYVDGQKSEILKTNIMLCGLALTAGEHTIELRYRMPGIGVSLALSALGLVILAAALVIRRKKHAAQHYHSML